MSEQPHTSANGSPSVGLGILSWKARQTLRASLESHRDAGEGDTLWKQVQRIRLPHDEKQKLTPAHKLTHAQ